MEDRPAYPVRLEGRLDPQLSRWLWLVKWLLAIPHFIVLFFLWIAFVVLTIVAFFAILFTGRYPRASSTSTSACSLDLARLVLLPARWASTATRRSRSTSNPTIQRHSPSPTRNGSRELVLVKWWLLAIPQYILVGIFIGGALRGRRGSRPGRVALVRRRAHRCPRALRRSRAPLHGAVSARPLRPRRRPRSLGGAVVAYAVLMTDAYPPFRLDQGEDDPAGAATMAPDASPAGAALEQPPFAAETGQRADRREAELDVALIVVGVIAALLSLALLAGGTALVVVDQVQRDEDGFLMSPSEDFSTATYAIVSESADVDFGALSAAHGRSSATSASAARASATSSSASPGTPTSRST